MKNRVVMAAVFNGKVEWSRIVAAFTNKEDAIKYGDELTVRMQGYDITVEEKWSGGWVVTHRNGAKVDVQNNNTPYTVSNMWDAFSSTTTGSIDNEGHEIMEDSSEEDEDSD